MNPPPEALREALHLNPNVTFLSASLLAGDRSLTTTVAHEIVHAWSGNWVTNARWRDFWLNEGFAPEGPRLPRPGARCRGLGPLCPKFASTPSP